MGRNARLACLASFVASNLETAGRDQRKIDRWMGHPTEVRRRYQHLRPDDQQEDISVLWRVNFTASQVSALAENSPIRGKC